MRLSSKWGLVLLLFATLPACDESSEPADRQLGAALDSLAAARADDRSADDGDPTTSNPRPERDPEGAGRAEGEEEDRADEGEADAAATSLAVVSSSRPTPPITIPDEPPRFERPEHVRGIYLNAWASGSTLRTRALIELADRTEINTFVIDVKDASGYVSYSTTVPLAREVGATEEIRIRDISLLLQRLKEADIYPIARIVVFQDPLLANRRPDLAIQDSTGGVWEDGSGHSWVNPYNTDVWDYNIALAEEAARLGFPEIQWDYVRFPDASREDMARARFPGQDGRRRSIAIRDFLIYGNEALDPLDVAVTADVFGVATSATSDVGIGQLWEDFIDVVQVALPMVYPSHYWTGSFGIQQPNHHPYEIVRAALQKGLERSRDIPGAGSVRPWLQDFTLGEPRYGAPEVRAQIQATYDAGIEEWILWNAAGRYTEAALAPASDFPEGSDPLIRFGNRLVPTSERFTTLPEEFALPADFILPEDFALPELQTPAVVPSPTRPLATPDFRSLPVRTDSVPLR